MSKNSPIMAAVNIELTVRSYCGRSILIRSFTIVALMAGFAYLTIGQTQTHPVSSYWAMSSDPTVIRSKLYTDANIRCMALNLYHEARGENPTAIMAVGHVVLNRVKSRKFPNDVCEVIKQGGEKRHKCQFSWLCDGRSDKVDDNRSYRKMIVLSKQLLFGGENDITNGSVFYHARYVNPYWAPVMKLQTRVGNHVFYSRL